MPSLLAVAGLVDDEGTLRVRRRQRILAQPRDPPRRHGLGVPLGFGQKELQLLHRRGLRLRDGLSAHERRQGLVAVTRQQQPSKILTEAPALNGRMEQVVEAMSILLERHRDGRGLVRCGHRPPPSGLARFPLCYHIL